MMDQCIQHRSHHQLFWNAVVLLLALLAVLEVLRWGFCSRLALVALQRLLVLVAELVGVRAAMTIKANSSGQGASPKVASSDTTAAAAMAVVRMAVVAAPTTAVELVDVQQLVACVRSDYWKLC